MQWDFSEWRKIVFVFKFCCFNAHRSVFQVNWKTRAKAGRKLWIMSFKVIQIYSAIHHVLPIQRCRQQFNHFAARQFSRQNANRELLCFQFFWSDGISKVRWAISRYSREKFIECFNHNNSEKVWWKTTVISLQLRCKLNSPSLHCVAAHKWIQIISSANEIPRKLWKLLQCERGKKALRLLLHVRVRCCTKH